MIERFYQDNKVKDIRIGGERILRVLNQGKAVYPNVVRDGLVLHYDFRGYTNDNLKRVIAYDLSGSGNHGELKNFAFSEGSGYDGQGLVFDGVDDFIQLPELGLDADNFTVMINDNVVSYRGEQVAQVVDGDVEIGGRNLFLNSLNRIVLLSNSPKYPIQDQAVSGENYRRFRRTYPEGITSTEISTYTREFFTPEKSGYYTYSTYFRPNEFDIELMLRFNGYGNYILCKANQWTQVSVTAYIEAGVATRLYGVYGAMSPEAVQWIDYNRVSVTSGNKPTDWIPAPEDVETTAFKPFFDKKIKSALYWNRALTDEELLQVYNTQIKRT